MGLPRVESNLYTRYETYIQITQDGLPTYVAFKQISFVANTFQTATVSNQCYNIRLISL